MTGNAMFDALLGPSIWFVIIGVLVLVAFVLVQIFGTKDDPNNSGLRR